MAPWHVDLGPRMTYELAQRGHCMRSCCAWKKKIFSSPREVVVVLSTMAFLSHIFRSDFLSWNLATRRISHNWCYLTFNIFAPIVATFRDLKVWSKKFGTWKSPFSYFKRGDRVREKESLASLSMKLCKSIAKTLCISYVTTSRMLS